mmetsp:Transcript_37608/g.79299  ORF Transcript_37608/g.79299 Transcript_37608/m.79299 type:complete len:210 (+) Transcript_37608:450-1079(+)
MSGNTMSTTATPERARPCCGCCCDYRRAVIIVDLVIIALEVLVLILLASDTASNYVVLYEDDDIVKTEMIFSAVSIVTGLISIYGAYIYNIWPVLLNVAWLLVGFIVAIIVVVKWCDDYLEQYNSDYYYATCSVNPGAVIWQGILMLLWMYPHVGFVVQVINGTLTKDNYVPQSCCCVADTQRVDQQAESRVVVTQASPSKMEQGAMNA